MADNDPLRSFAEVGSDRYFQLVTVRPALRIIASATTALIAASVAALALVFLCTPLVIGADMPNWGWLETVAIAIVIFGAATAFIISFREMMKKLAR